MYNENDLPKVAPCFDLDRALPQFPKSRPKFSSLRRLSLATIEVFVIGGMAALRFDKTELCL
jgi:hypothetical protein